MVGDVKPQVDRPIEDILFELDDLWRAALTQGHHGAGCSCCAAPMVVLTGDVLEQDILFHLRRTYRANGSIDLLDFIDQRDEKRQGGFIGWLRELGSSVAPGSFARLLNDIIPILRSVRGH